MRVFPLRQVITALVALAKGELLVDQASVALLGL